MRRIAPCCSLLLLAAGPLQAQRSLAIERFDAAIAVQRNGSVDVTETITAQFTGAWNGIYRTVPVDYHTPQGFNWTLRLDLLGATDARRSDAQGREPAGTPLHQVQDLGARGRERHPHRRAPVPGRERAPLLRGARRALLERHRRRVGRAHRGRGRADHLAGRRHRHPRDRLQRRLRLDRARREGGHRGDDHQRRHAAPARLSTRGSPRSSAGTRDSSLQPTEADKALGFLASNWPLLIPLARPARDVRALVAERAGSRDGSRSWCSTSRRTRSPRRRPAR